MNKVIDKILDIYNVVYLYINSNVLKGNEEKINNLMLDVFSNSHLEKNDINTRKIKVVLVKEHKKENQKDKTIINTINKSYFKIMKQFIKMGIKKSIENLPRTAILIDKKQEHKDIQLKRNYKDEILSSQSKENQKLKQFLQSPEIQNLAKKIDSNMHERLTIQDFAEFVTIKLKDDIDDYCFKNKIDTSSDNFADIGLALLLLQQNPLFQESIDQLIDIYYNGQAYDNHILYGMLNYKSGMSAIANFKM